LQPANGRLVGFTNVLKWCKWLIHPTLGGAASAELPCDRQGVESQPDDSAAIARWIMLEVPNYGVETTSVDIL